MKLGGFIELAMYVYVCAAYLPAGAMSWVAM
jgi:hypothetical protein